jgi:4-alpha-glucanotransferase
MEKLNRKSGILLHITSLPNNYRLGCFSKEALDFVDFLADGKFGCWQVLPFADCGYAKSPYSAVSSFAINPYLIDVSRYLTESEMHELGFNKQNANKHEEEKKIDKALDIVYKKHRKSTDLSQFEKVNKYWLDDYALYKVIKEKHDYVAWTKFPLGLRNKVKLEIDAFSIKYAKELDKVKFCQFIAQSQWEEIKKYANSKGIEVFGDLPMYVELDSADVWSKPKEWQLEDGKPKSVAGVPPDYFNEEGQLWGYPLYNYTAMQKNKYDYWVKRVKRQSDFFDILRIDHFIAFSRYWSIPSKSLTAKSGKYFKGYGDEILKQITSKCKIKIVAEDLGVVTKDVCDLREKHGIAGLKVLQFAFDDIGDHMYQPHNYERNSVACLGTHDNDTFMGLLNEGNWDKINRFKRYLRMPLEQGNDMVLENAIIALYRSSANLVILTAQDILKYGTEHRMNIPGTTENNWLWQLHQPLDKSLTYHYKDLSELYGR